MSVIDEFETRVNSCVETVNKLIAERNQLKSRVKELEDEMRKVYPSLTAVYNKELWESVLKKEAR